jgi:hypothetical protein
MTQYISQKVRYITRNEEIQHSFNKHAVYLLLQDTAVDTWKTEN